MPIGSPNAGYLTFNTGQVLTAAQVQYNLQNQTIMYFANAAARDAALGVGVVQEGMFAYLADTNTTVYYDGAAWQSFGTGDVTGLTAGAGITITNASGPVPTIAVSTNATLTSPKETVQVVATPGATGIVDIDTLTASVELLQSDATANWTTNVRGSGAATLNSTMAIGEQISVVLLNKNGATAYYPTGFTIDSSAVTPLWLGGTAPSSGNINAIDAYVYTIIKTAATPTYTVLASQNRFA
jgi:hypothetical protein